MRRMILVLVIGSVLVTAAIGAAASLTVGFSTLGTGTGDVAKCGDVEGVTWLLKGQTVGGNGGSVGTGTTHSIPPDDITKTIGVNIETILDCVVNDNTDGSADDGVQVHVQALKSNGDVIATGTCEVGSHGGVGFDEAGASDNLPGCTATFAETPVADIVDLVVTMT